jgi:hypothetical protein
MSRTPKGPIENPKGADPEPQRGQNRTRRGPIENPKGARPNPKGAGVSPELGAWLPRRWELRKGWSRPRIRAHWSIRNPAKGSKSGPLNPKGASRRTAKGQGPKIQKHGKSHSRVSVPERSCMGSSLTGLQKCPYDSPRLGKRKRALWGHNPPRNTQAFADAMGHGVRANTMFDPNP